MSIAAAQVPVTTVATQPQPRIRRKPAPSFGLDVRYPDPDPQDPFAPLSVLRSRTSSTLAYLAASTSDLPSLPYRGGEPFPTNPYYYPAKVPAPFEKETEKLVPFQITEHANTRPISIYDDEPVPRRPLSSVYTLNSNLPRRRTQSAVSRREANFSVPPSKPSPYGHQNLQAYVLASSHTPFATRSPAVYFCADTSTAARNRSSIQIARQTSLPGPIFNSPIYPASSVHLPEGTAEYHSRSSSKRSRAAKFARLLPSRSRLSLAQCSRENISRKPSLQVFPSISQSTVSVAPISRPPKAKDYPEENTFRPRRKSSALYSIAYPPLDVCFPPGSFMESFSDSELGYVTEPGTESSCNPSTPHISPPTHLMPRKSHTMPLPRPNVDSHTKQSPGSDRSRPSTAPPTPVAFDERALPSVKQLAEAASLHVIAENGLRVPFGELFKDQKTVVIFIRHFWCHLCQDYMTSISENVDPKVLRQAGVQLVIISNGSYNLIRSYRRIFHCQFTVYTDPSMLVYKALGMLRSGSGQPAKRSAGYIRHGPVRGITMVMMNALKVGMPVWEKGGDVGQLGGEFVLGPGLKCTYAHRMPTNKGHAPIVEVLAAANIDVYVRYERGQYTSTHSTSTPPVLSEHEEEAWMEERRKSLTRLREKRRARRGGSFCGIESLDKLISAEAERERMSVSDETIAIACSCVKECIAEEEELTETDVASSGGHDGNDTNDTHSSGSEGTKAEEHSLDDEKTIDVIIPDLELKRCLAFCIA